MAEPENTEPAPEPLEMPHTSTPTIAGILLIVAMVLFLVTAGVIYYTASNIDDMTGTGPVSGYIKETYLGRKLPVENVKVSIDGTNLTSFSDSDGYYEIENVPVGVQKIRYEKLGYRVVILKIIIFSKSDLEDNFEESNNFSFPDLSRGGFEFESFDRNIEDFSDTLQNGTLRLQILNESGTPVPGLTVSYVQSTEKGAVESGFSYNGTTDSSGELVLNRTPGRYMLNITRPGYGTLLKEVLIKPDTQESVVLTLRPGSGTIENRIFRTVTMSGRIQTGDGEPIADVSVEVQGTEISTVTNPAGEYTLNNVPVGAKTLFIGRLGYSAVSAELFLIDNQTGDFNMSKLKSRVYDNSDVGVYFQCAITYIVIALMLLAGGIAAFKRKSYGVAMIAAAFGVIGPIPFLFGPIPCITTVICIIALAAVFYSRREFS